MIELKNVSKTYYKQRTPFHALSGVSLHVGEGEIFGVIGLSGAGKSTLIRCINLLEKPTTGQVVVNGVLLSGLGRRQLAQERKQIGMIFQQFNLLSSRTVFENVAFPLELNGLASVDIVQRVENLLGLVGLLEKRDEYPASLSGGQKQRVAIARTLANNPKVLLCDEATSSLDPETTMSILGLLKDINRRFRITILLITHEMNVVKSICDRVAVIDGGRLIEQGTVSEIFSFPRHPLTRRLIDSSLHFNIPPEYEQRLRAGRVAEAGDRDPVEAGNPLVKLEFSAQSANLPLLSLASRLFEVDNHIIFAQLDQAGGLPFGFVLIEIRGAAENTQKAIDYYIANAIKTEVLGYV
jgi:D-methionine transport system ATP-binding protein